MTSKHVNSGLGHSLSPAVESMEVAWCPRLRAAPVPGLPPLLCPGSCCSSRGGAGRSLAGQGAIPTSSGVVSGPLALGREAPPWPRHSPWGHGLPVVSSHVLSGQQTDCPDGVLSHSAHLRPGSG